MGYAQSPFLLPISALDNFGVARLHEQHSTSLEVFRDRVDAEIPFNVRLLVIPPQHAHHSLIRHIQGRWRVSVSQIVERTMAVQPATDDGR